MESKSFCQKPNTVVLRKSKIRLVDWVDLQTIFRFNSVPVAVLERNFLINSTYFFFSTFFLLCSFKRTYRSVLLLRRCQIKKKKYLCFDFMSYLKNLRTLKKTFSWFLNKFSTLFISKNNNFRKKNDKLMFS